jgi:hypothetical protein
MSSCLVRQLFRQKIGQELDQAIVDEVLFPLLRQRKHGPRDLLLDIKMTRRWDEHGDSMITRPGRRAVTRRGRYTLEKNMSPFTRIPSTLESVRADQEVKERKRLGKLNSRFRREMTMRKKWGTVDILNELRELKHPVIECHPVPDGTRHIDHPWEIYPKDEFPADAYIRLEEMSDSRLREIVVAGCDLCGSWSKSPLYSNDKMLRNKEKAIIKEDLLFVNRYLEHSLSNGGLYWVNRRYIYDHFSYAPSLSSSY